MSQNIRVNHRTYSFISILLLFLLFLSTTGCSKASDSTEEISFTADVVSLSEDTLLVRPDDGTKEDELCSQIYVPTDTQITDTAGNTSDLNELSQSKRVEVVYDGVLDNSDPALIANCYQIIILE